MKIRFFCADNLDKFVYSLFSIGHNYFLYVILYVYNTYVKAILGYARHKINAKSKRGAIQTKK